MQKPHMPSQQSPGHRSHLVRPSILKNRGSDVTQSSSLERSRKSSGNSVNFNVPTLSYENDDLGGNLLEWLSLQEAHKDLSKGNSGMSGVTFYDAPANHIVYTTNDQDPKDLDLESIVYTTNDQDPNYSDLEREAELTHEDDLNTEANKKNCSSDPEAMGPEMDLWSPQYFSSLEPKHKPKARKQALALGESFEWPDRPVTGDGTPTYIPHEEHDMMATRAKRSSQGTEVAEWYKVPRGPSYWRSLRAADANQAMAESRTSIGAVDLEKLKAGSSAGIDHSESMETVRGFKRFNDTESSPPTHRLFSDSRPISDSMTHHSHNADHCDADDESDREDINHHYGHEGGESESEDSDDGCLAMPVVKRGPAKNKLVTSARSVTPDLSFGTSSPCESPSPLTRFKSIRRVETNGSASGTDKEISFKPSKLFAGRKKGFYIGSSDEDDDEDNEDSD